jgi:hypothetical protein
MDEARVMEEPSPVHEARVMEEGPMHNHPPHEGPMNEDGVEGPVHDHPAHERPMNEDRVRSVHDDHSPHERPMMEKWPVYHHPTMETWVEAVEALMTVAEMSGLGGLRYAHQGGARDRQTGQGEL